MLIRFRNPKRSDIPQLLRIARKNGFDKEDILLPINYSANHCFVMLVENKIVGASLYIKIDKELAYSSLWFIEPKYAELADELMESSYIDLKRLGVKRLIGTVKKTNKKMFNNFMGLGWKKAGEMKNQILIYKELKG